MTVEQALLTMVALLATTATALWAIIGAALRIAPWASLRLMVANLLLGLSVATALQRAQGPSWLAWPVSDLLGLLAFVLAREAVQRLFRRPRSWRLDASLWCAAALVYAALPPDASSTGPYTLLYSGCVAVFAAGLAWDVWQAARQAFGAPAGAALAAPFALLVLLMGLRGGAQLLRPPELAPGDPQGLLWAFVALTLLLNVSLMVCVLARLLIVIRQRAERDPLTGLSNRRHFEQSLRREHARAARSSEPYALVLLDLDHFKQVNDQHGRDGGDAALRHVARLMEASLREFDSLGRLGGEEFALLLPATDAAGAQVAERLRARSSLPLEHRGQQIPLSASFGIAIGQGHGKGHGGDGTELFRQADQALYAAKTAGRNQVALAPS
ncbi:MAG: GGDEF domain-containing protein [Inhella sp.]